MFNLRAHVPLFVWLLEAWTGLKGAKGGGGGGPMVKLGKNGGWLMETRGLWAQSLRWLLGLEMRKPALHSGLIEDAPLPMWNIHYLWVFTNSNWHFHQLWMSVSDLVTLGVSGLPPDKMKILVKYNCLVLQSKDCSVGWRLILNRDIRLLHKIIGY